MFTLARSRGSTICCASMMAGAFQSWRCETLVGIDMAKAISKDKPYFMQWHCIFGKADTFTSLLQQYDEAKNVQGPAAEGGWE